MTFLGWLAAMVALLTGTAMLKDTYLSLDDRADLRAILRRAWRAFDLFGPSAVDRAEISIIIRLILRTAMLVLIVASSGVCVCFPTQNGTYETLLRCALAAFMAMQAPCPWLRWITLGDRRHTTASRRRANASGMSSNVVACFPP